MEGDGYGLDGHRYHLDSPGSQGWVDIHGHLTENWAARPPYWRAVGWRNKHGGVTYPLARGGWSNGRARRYRPPTGISFARGPSRHLRFWYSIATDRRTIPKGRWVYVRAYRHTPARGWFRAQDTGGAVKGHHIDVYRPPPRHPSAGTTLTGRAVWVAPRGFRPVRGAGPGGGGGVGPA
jgi:3D (Asp-Asp-Asp) domain-containing protein